jgi:pilus assembly protein CpaE
MIKHAQQVAASQTLETAAPPLAPEMGAEEHIAPAPRVSGQAFCETVETAAAVQAASEDRRLAKAHIKIQMGGATAAAEAYNNSPTPNVILIESENRAEELLGSLDRLAEVCDPGTRVVVIGRINDVGFYRELTKRGISDYLISPVGTIDMVRAICGLFSQQDAKPVGRLIAIVGAKGGVGASTVAHNIGFAIAKDLSLASVVTDLDLAFGTAGLDFNQDPPQGIADAVFSPDRIDVNFVDRLLSKCTDHLSLLAAPATLDRVYDFNAEAFDGVLDALRASIPCIVLDVPHQWLAWTKRVLVSADDILVVAGPDLANLRNAKNLVDMLKSARPNDHRPYYCLNQIGVPKRPEISVGDFAKALEDEPLAAIPFEPQLFGTAANNGQMVAEISSAHKTAEMFRQLAQILTGRAEVKRPRSAFAALPFLGKLMKKKA